MEKRRIRLEINGVVCGLLTEESDEYMHALAQEVGKMMTKIQAASPLITLEAAATMVALNYCDEAKREEQRVYELKQRNAEMERRILENERQIAQLKKENMQLWEETDALLNQQDNLRQDEIDQLQKEMESLKSEYALLRAAKRAEPMKEMPDKEIKLLNPLRDYQDEKGYISFFEKSGENGH